MTPIEVRAISAAETRPLRQSVLRPTQRPDELVYAGDDDVETLHAGAFVEGRLAGIASICREPPPGERDAGAWRLRGMATTPERRRSGLGRRLLDACFAHVAARGGTRVWCNARVTAADFYLAYGFVVLGEPFELPHIGPHYLMWRAVAPAPRPP